MLVHEPFDHLNNREEAPFVVDATDAPEPRALLAKMAEVNKTVTETAQPQRKVESRMPPTSPFDSPEPMGVLKALGLAATVAIARPKEKSEQAVPIAEAAPKKKGWFVRIADKVAQTVDKGFEKLGNFLDRTLPAISVAAVAVVLGGMGSHTEDFAKVSRISESTTQSSAMVDTPAPVKVTAITPIATQVAVPDSATITNQTLIEKHAEIVQHAGGEKARYLHSEASHQHFIAQLVKFGGFTTILNHPKVREAKTTAQMVNLVDQYFGEKVADLVEANAAAMHLPAGGVG